MKNHDYYPKNLIKDIHTYVENMLHKLFQDPQMFTISNKMRKTASTFFKTSLQRKNLKILNNLQTYFSKIRKKNSIIFRVYEEYGKKVIKQSQ